MKRIVILGAGTGGTLTANILARELRREIQEKEVSIQLIGEGFDHVFQPANLDIAFHGANPHKAVRNESSLLRKEVDFVPDPASAVDMAERTVTSSRGGKLPYDYLVFATGSVARPDAMPGLREGSLNFHTGPYNAARIWESLQDFKGGKALIVIASVPHKCPPSPNEAAFMLDDFLRKKGIRNDTEIKFLTPYPRAYPAEKVSEVVQPLFEQRGIELIPFFNADSVDPAAKKVYSMEGEAHEYDLLLAVPPHRGAEVVGTTGIADADLWIPTNKNTMRVKGHSDTFALGDATDIPISKSGVVAHLQSGIVAHNVLSDLGAAPDMLEYNGRINCPMETGHRRALFVSGTYAKPPESQHPTFMRYAMKHGFAKMYWSTLRGRWETIMDAYFGETSTAMERGEEEGQTVEVVAR